MRHAQAPFAARSSPCDFFGSLLRQRRLVALLLHSSLIEAVRVVVEMTPSVAVLSAFLPERLSSMCLESAQEPRVQH